MPKDDKDAPEKPRWRPLAQESNEEPAEREECQAQNQDITYHNYNNQEQDNTYTTIWTYTVAWSQGKPSKWNGKDTMKKKTQL